MMKVVRDVTADAQQEKTRKFALDKALTLEEHAGIVTPVI